MKNIEKKCYTISSMQKIKVRPEMEVAFKKVKEATVKADMRYEKVYKRGEPWTKVSEEIKNRHMAIVLKLEKELFLAEKHKEAMHKKFVELVDKIAKEAKKMEKN